MIATDCGGIWWEETPLRRVHGLYRKRCTDSKCERPLPCTCEVHHEKRESRGQSARKQQCQSSNDVKFTIATSAKTQRGRGPPTNRPVIDANAASVFAYSRRTAQDDGAEAIMAASGQGCIASTLALAVLAQARIAPVVMTGFWLALHAPRLSPEASFGRDVRVPARVDTRRAFGTRQAPLRDTFDRARGYPNCLPEDESVPELRPLERMKYRSVLGFEAICTSAISSPRTASAQALRTAVAGVEAVVEGVE
eukprot:361775-Rhodomonas_salina.1